MLVEKGYRIRERNLRTSRGEIDIIAEQGETLVLVEVKTRRSNSAETALASITPAKRKRLTGLARSYIAQGNFDLEPEVRFDVVAVGVHAGVSELLHVEGAITCDD